ncbi:MAG: hypothetical protein Q8N53_02455 [Longimicrobiales bacterium]|nr:hypothetical protein [Longimicrobiales bacterium]
MTPGSRRAGSAVGDVLLAVAGVALVLAMAYPRIERALMGGRVDAAQADVDAVGAAVAAFRAERHEWPPAAELGVVPPDLVGFLPRDFSFQSAAYHLKWDRWETVVISPPPEVPELDESAFDATLPPPPDSLLGALPVIDTLGSISVQSDDERILAALQERFGASRSFIRGMAWTLVFTDESGG